VGNAEFDRMREQLEARLNQNPTYRAMKPVDMSWLIGYLRVDPATGIAPSIDVVTSDGVRPMVWLSKWRYIVARFDGLATPEVSTSTLPNGRSSGLATIWARPSSMATW
jgi:hypothetical protein